MLLRFSVENAFCFGPATTLSMTASADTRHPEHVSMGANTRIPNVLRTAGIYGANGHGKTQFVRALTFCKMMAIGDEDAIPEIFNPFLLGDASHDKAARFVLEFRVDQRDFEYGLVINNRMIEQEWLFSDVSTKEEVVFTREIRQNSDHNSKTMYDFRFGRSIKSSSIEGSEIKTNQYLNFITAAIGNRASFISEAFKRNIVYIYDIHKWFAETLQIITADSSYINLISRADEDKSFLKFLKTKIRECDAGVSDLQIKRTPISEDVLEALSGGNSEFKDAISSLEVDEAVSFSRSLGSMLMIQRSTSGLDLIDFVTLHKTLNGTDVEFTLEQESSGTKRLLDLFPMMFDLVKKDRVYVVDELDRKLHPLLAYKLVQDYLSAGRGQLIFTTHTTFLLDLDLLRRDEVWFVQKRKDGSSDLYSLADFKVRLDLDVRKGYLNGRFGGIPFLGDIQALGWQ